MKMFFTSDWHLNHAAVIGFDQRPFRDLSHMREELIRRYNSVVTPDAVCYFLGDNCFGASAYLAETLTRLNGTKIAILGNHDKGHLALQQAGFSSVLNSASLYVAGKLVTLSHCPLRGVFREDASAMRGYLTGDNWHGESRSQQFSVVDEGQFHLHGHIHSGPSNDKLTRTERQWDVGAPGNNYTPVSFWQVVKWIQESNV